MERHIISKIQQTHKLLGQLNTRFTELQKLCLHTDMEECHRIGMSDIEHYRRCLLCHKEIMY